MRNVAWRRVGWAVAFPFAWWAVAALATDALYLNPILILVVISLSAGVCVAFLPNVALFFRRDRPLDIFALVTLGIFYGWLSNIVRPAVPLVVDLWPPLGWIRDSDISSFGFSLAITSAVVHLVAPSIDGRGKIPRKRWATIGIVVALTVGVGIVALDWQELSGLFYRDRAELHPTSYRASPGGFFGR